MVNVIDFSGRPFHFIGIGGIGMSAIAHILVEQHLPVSGSDVNLNHITQRLQQKGARVFSRQDAANLETFQAENRFHDKELRASGEPYQATEISNVGSQPTAVATSQMSTSATPGTTITPQGTISQNTSPHGSAVKSSTVNSSVKDWRPQVVCSTAIDTSNPEYRAALDLGCPIFHRSDVLAALIQRHNQSIAVGGTHGKTTTSSMIAHMLLYAGVDPTIVVGGEVETWGGNARLGNGTHLVAEADESDGSLVKFFPHIGIVTNIELDHPDHYTSLDEVVTIFKQFQSQSTVLIACLDCPTVQASLKPTLSYAVDASSGADYTVRNIAFKTNQTCATVYERGQPLGTLTLRLLGHHNLSNALAAVAVGRYLNLPFETIAAGLERFRGARRRFEQRGHYANITFLDDYAHHPSELKATLGAARRQASRGRSMIEPMDSSLIDSVDGLLDDGAGIVGNERSDRPPRASNSQEHSPQEHSPQEHSPQERSRIVAVFQPHRYSRTATFLDEFAQSFDDADVVILTDIYSAGEENKTGIRGQQVADAIAQHHPQVIYKPSLPDVEAFLKDALESGDLVLFLGAGNVNKIIPDLMEFYRQKEHQMVQSSVYGS